MTCDQFRDDQGQDQSSLETASEDALCLAEYYVHALVLRISFTVVVFIMLNVGRFLLIAGAVRLMWKWMNTGLYSVLASADALGQLHVDEDKLADKIGGMLGRLQLFGALFVVLALLSQSVWLVGLDYYSKKMIALEPN